MEALSHRLSVQRDLRFRVIHFYRTSEVKSTRRVLTATNTYQHTSLDSQDDFSTAHESWMRGRCQFRCAGHDAQGTNHIGLDSPRRHPMPRPCSSKHRRACGARFVPPIGVAGRAGGRGRVRVRWQGFPCMPKGLHVYDPYVCRISSD